MLSGLMQAAAMVHHALNPLDMFDFTALKDLEQLMVSTVPTGDVLKEESTRRLWNLSFKAVVESIDRPDKDRGIARRVSTN